VPEASEREAEDATPSGRLVIADEGDLFVMNADGSERRALVRADGMQFDQIGRPTGARWSIGIRRAAGRALLRGRGRLGGDKPDARPGRRLVASWLAVDEEGVVAFVPADGSGPILRLAGDALRGGFPAWAPAG
jgi:hypothetical protein